MSSVLNAFSKNSDIALVAVLIGILAILFMPVPAAVLDFLIVCNFSLALLILLLTFYTHKPVEFSTFPSMLLIATLFRLALNVSATRLILSEGDAGQVIGAIGEHVVGGSYIIGIIVFLILVVVQYVVVTAGAQRVAEVAARFTLDSMPGQQMSIDADLNMGFIDQKEAQRRRKELEKEANFYGAMDGASKFVKGDAIAGIVILLIDIVGGFAIGVMQLGMHWTDALQRYTLLTIGDGIVTQVPALIISVGTGIIVTRSAEDARLSNEAVRQLLAYPRTLLLILGALGLMLFLPGLPAWPVLILGAVFFGLWLASRRVAMQREAARAEASPSGAADTAIKESGMLPLEVCIAPDIYASADFNDPPFLQRINELRSRLRDELGFVLPDVKITVKQELSSGEYLLNVEGVELARGQLQSGMELLLASGGRVSGVELNQKDPVFGMPAKWIATEDALRFKAMGVTVADASTVLLTHFTELVQRHSADLLSRAAVEQMLEGVRVRQSSLLEELVPALLSISDIQRVLQLLLREKISIRNMDAILEVLVDKARSIKDPGVLADQVRLRLASAIYQSLLGKREELPVLTLEPMTEMMLLESVKKLEAHQSLLIDPRIAEQLIVKLSEQMDLMLKQQLSPVILCQPELRRQLRLFLERVLPQMSVVGLNELPLHARVRAFATVKAA